MNKLEQTGLYHDTASLDQLRQAAQKDDKKALREVAQHFESIFMRMMLKSMRQAEDVLADDSSPFNSQDVKFYRGMHDDQMASDLSSSGALGLADLIVEQLSPNQGHNLDKTQLQMPERSAYSFKQAQASLPTKPSTETVTAKESVSEQAVHTGFAGKEDFVSQLLPVAEQAAKKLGLSPVALVAQAALETGWGQKMIKKPNGENALNFFGIKADGRWQGEKATVGTLEYRQGVAKVEKASFRAYSSIDESLQDYVSFVQSNPRYQKAIESASDNSQYFQELQQAGYATDPEYSSKILNILKDPLFSPANNVLKF